MSPEEDIQIAFPHVFPWQIPLCIKYKDLLRNTGGNDPLELANDLQNPDNTWFSQSNFPRFVLAVGVTSQLGLLFMLRQEGLLK